MKVEEIRVDRETIEAMLSRWIDEYGITHPQDREWVENILKALSAAHFALRCWESLNEPRL